MIKSEKKVKELSSLLDRQNSLLISRAIGMLRDEEPFEGAIGLLTSFYDKSDDPSVRKSIEGFMNDIKDQSATKEIIAEIRKPFKQTTISMLVSSCWQSGLNYSQYIRDLAEVFLKADYVTAIECLTVIEGSANHISRTTKNEIINILDEFPFSAGNEKVTLALELISVLRT